jgi:hypothetical protein
VFQALNEDSTSACHIAPVKCTSALKKIVTGAGNPDIRQYSSHQIRAEMKGRDEENQ